MSVSATEAAFEGFRLTRRRPGAVVLWAGVWLLGLIAMMAVSMPLIAPWAEEIAAAKGDATALSAGALAGLQNMSLALVPLVLLLQGLLATAVYRAVLRPEETRFGSLRLGADEGRVLLVGLLTGGLTFALNFGLDQAVTRISAAAGPIIALAVWAVATVLLVALSVRLSLIAPLTFLRRKLAFREGWKASGPRFWPLLGMTILVIVMALIVLLLLVLIGMPMQAAMNAAGGPGSPAAALGALLLLILMPLGAAMVTTIVWAPFAALCKDLPEA